MANRIRELRKEHGLTMKQLGVYVGLAESTISQYETGKRQPDNETLLKFGELFGVSVDYILGSGQKSPQEPISIDDFTYAMYQEGQLLTEENKQKLLEMAAFFRHQQEKGK